MLSSVSYIIVMALLAVEGSTASTCSSDEEIFQFSISSKKNSSLHRIFQVHLTKGTSNGSGEISLDVEHGRSLCNNGELVRLSTSVSGNTLIYFQEYRTECPMDGCQAAILETPVRRADYELFPGLGYYKLHTTAQLWEAAREICVREGAHLIVINSDAESNVVKEYFSRKPSFSGSTFSGGVFAGFHDKYTEGDYVTVTGVSLKNCGYEKWAPAEPDGGTISNFGVLNSQGLLLDISNGSKLGFICEQEL